MTLILHVSRQTSVRRPGLFLSKKNILQNQKDLASKNQLLILVEDEVGHLHDLNSTRMERRLVVATHWTGFEASGSGRVCGLPRDCRGLFNWGKKRNTPDLDEAFADNDQYADEFRRLRGDVMPAKGGDENCLSAKDAFDYESPDERNRRIYEEDVQS